MKIRAVGTLFCLAAMVALSACEREVVPVDYAAIRYKGKLPSNVVVNKNVSAENIPALEKRVDFRYPVMVGDTLDVSILEFKSDVFALDYYMNSGKFQGLIPILRGSFLEQSIRSDNRIFIFKHDSFRRYERSDLESFVRGIPGYRGGFPQEFLSLPFEHRAAGRSSIQTRYFLGQQSRFPVLVQSYQDESLQWNVARSWEQVEEADYLAWVQGLRAATPRGIATQSDCEYFTSGFENPAMGGAEARGIATRLPGGRVVVVWGFLDWFDLERKFFTASDRVYEALY